jgi:hypothetical protein
MTTLAQVLELAEQLTPIEQATLVERLLSRLSSSTTREMLLVEFERRKQAHLFDHEESLYGKYANPAVNISSEELDATIRQFANEWEQELDDLN